MTPALLVLRPEPGASRTAAAARATGWTAIVAPLFGLRPLAWEVPGAGEVDSMLLTSANALDQAGPGLVALRHLPAYAVGATTAAAARALGIEPRAVGEAGVDALAARLTADGFVRPLHLAGADRRAPVAGLAALHRATFVAEPVSTLPGTAAAALRRGAIALLHSPRAAALFGRLVDAAGIARAHIELVAISAVARDAAGTGWGSARAAATPDHSAMLAAAARLCERVSDRGREEA